MDLINKIKNSDFSGLKDYVSDRIASIVSDKVITARDTFTANARGLTLEDYQKSLEEKDEKKKEEKEEDDSEKETPAA